jgi:serine/threonine-protein kinase
MQVARAMKRAHEAGIVHRDLKPDNIFLVPNDDEEIVKVLDFGIAKAASPLSTSISESTRTGTMLGTPYYMSPEQVESATNADHRTDIWALGVIAYQCILGKRPFEAETVGGLFLAICSKELPVPSQRGPVPPGFDTWFARACARDLAKRFGSAREAAAELRLVCGDERNVPNSVEPELDQEAPAFGNTTGQGAAVGVSTPPPSRTSRRSWFPLVLAGAAVVLGLVAWQMLRSPAERTSTPPAAMPANDRGTASQPVATPTANFVPQSPEISASLSAAPSARQVTPVGSQPAGTRVPAHSRAGAGAPARPLPEKKGKAATGGDVDLGL